MPETPASFLIGLIGSGIQASRTPAMHMLEASRQGLRYVYKLIDLEKLGLGVEALPELLNAAERLGFDGLNITHPCKQTVIPLLTDLSAEARAIGVVSGAFSVAQNHGVDGADGAGFWGQLGE